MYRIIFLSVFILASLFSASAWSQVSASPNPSTTGDITITWSGNGSVNYSVSESKDGGSSASVYLGSLTHATISGRSNGSYKYTVFGNYCDFICYASPIGSVTVTVSRIMAPSTPGSISAPSTSSNGSYSVSWGASSGTVTAYKLQERYNGGGWSTIQSSTSRSRSFNKSPSRYYDYRVKACNQSSCSAYTASKRVTLPAASVSASVSPYPLAFTTDTFTLNWSSVMASSCSWSGGSISGKSGSKSFTKTGWTYYDGLNQWGINTTVTCNVIGGGTVTKSVFLVANKVPPKPTVNVSWNKSSAFVGQSARLSWSTANANNCTLDGGGVSVNSSRNYTFSTSGTVNKTVTCTNAQGSTSASRSISVTYAVPGSPGGISAPSTATTGSYSISWAASSGTVTAYQVQERANGGSWSTLPNRTSRSVSFTKSANRYYDYRVRACNNSSCTGFGASKRVTIPAASITTSTNPYPLAFTTDAFTLNWNSVMTSGCSWTGGSISGKSGSKSFTKTGWTYNDGINQWIINTTMSCNVIGGGTVSKAVLLVANAVPPKPTVNVSWNKSSAYVGQSATLSWITADANSCTLDGSSVSVNSSRVYNFSTDGTVNKTVTCTNAQGNTSDSYSISVTYVVPGSPGTITAPSTATTGIYSVSWGASSGIVTAYQLQESVNGGGWATIHNNASRTASFTKNPSGYYDYRVRACNHSSCTGFGSSKRVSIPAASLTASASPVTMVFTKDDFTLSWNSVMTSSCQWSEGSLSSLIGSTPLSVDSGWIYEFYEQIWWQNITVQCSAIGGGTVSRTVTIRAYAETPKPTVNISWSSSSALVGNSATYSWTTSRANSCVIDGVAAATSGSVTQTFTASGDVIKSLTCTNDEGSTSGSATISVSAPPLPTAAISWNKTSANVGESATQSWSSTDADSCSIAGASVANSGSRPITFNLHGVVTETLMCVNVTGSASDTSTIIVLATDSDFPIAMDPADDSDTDEEFMGYLNGSFSVAASGNAHYSLPIEVPPGIRGIQPEMSITYSSAAKNGLLGWGWNLNGLSRIHRCSASVVRDNYVSGTLDDDEFKLCLDGQRLVEIVPGEYRTERESFKKIVENDDVGYTVYLKSGREIQYGVSSDARRASNNGATYVDWNINRVTDLTGNYMTYRYENNAEVGVHRIQRVEYTKNDAAGAAGINQSLDFNYEDRGDIVSGFWSGVYSQVDKRLASIDVQADGQLVRRYNLNYQLHDGNTYADPSHISRLSNINVCYDQYSTQCSDPVVIDWTSRAQDEFGFTESNLVSGIDDDTDYVLGDFDVDGEQEVLIVDREMGVLDFDAYLLEKGETYTGSADQYKISFTNIDVIAHVVDVNSDGRDDLILRAYNYGDLLVSYASENGFLEPVTFLEKAEYVFSKHFQFRDFNGDGRVDMFRSPAFLGDGTTRFEVAINFGNGQFDEFREWGLHNGGQPKTLKLADMNGDGLTDLVRCDYITIDGTDQDPNKCRFIVSINHGTGFMAQTYWGGTEVSSLSWSKRNNFDGTGSLVEQHMVLADVNGDGTADIVWADKSDVKVALNNGVGFEGFGVWLDQDITPVYWEAPPFSLVDINLDGYLDLVFRSSGFALNVAYNRGVHRSQGGTVVMGFSDPEPLGLSSESFSGMDANSNGVTDLLFAEPRHSAFNMASVVGTGVAINSLEQHLVKMIRTNDDQSATINYLPLTSDAVHTASETDDEYTGLVRADISAYQDTVANETNGTFASYISNVTRTRQVVASADTSDGVGGIIRSDYHYTGHLTHRGGWGSLGFKKFQVDRSIVSTGEKTRTISTYSQQAGLDESVGVGYTTVGLLLSQELFATNGVGDLQLTSYTVNNWEVQSLQDDHDAAFYGLYSPHYIIRRASSHTKTTDLNGADIKNSSSYVLSYDATAPVACGVLPETGITPEIPVSNSLSVAHDEYENVHQTVSLTCDGTNVFTSNQKVQYENRTSDQWLLGLETYKGVTTTAPDAGGALQSLTREHSAVFNARGLPQTSTRELNNAILLHSSAFSDYDAYGTVGRISETWNDTSGLGFSTRDSSTSVSYQNDGTRTITTTNALGQTSVSVIDGKFGLVERHIDINNLTTTTTYDSLGRILTVTAPGFTSLANRYRECNNCEAQSGYARSYVHSKETGTTPKRVYFDAYGREVGQRIIGLSGLVSYSQIDYGAAGKVVASSQPFFEGGDRYDTEFEYDSLGRVTHKTAPDGGVTVTQYNGLESTVTNVLGQRRVKWKNGIGQNIRTQDDLGSEIKYSYDPLANLIQTEVNGFDTALDVVTTMGYDLLGRQEYLDDPSLGRIDYTYNGLDLMATSMDAKGQQTAFSYDELGREIQRIDDATAPGAGIRTHKKVFDTVASGRGRLDRVTGYDTEGFAFVENYQYSDIGLPKKTTTTIQGETYETETYYDAFNRVVAIEYPTGFRVVNHYNDYGYRHQISDDLDDTVLWTATAADARGNVTSSVQGNGVVTTRGYDALTGRISSINAVYSGGSSTLVVQNQNFYFDMLGNLEERHDLRAREGTGYVEAFCYDSLSRLTSVGENTCGVGDITYDALGNFNQRTMSGGVVDTYSYDPSNPYLLTNVSSSNGIRTSYTYDANGNIVSGGGRTIDYTSFNKPERMTKDASVVEITYGPGKNRIKRVDDNLMTTTYVAGIYEKQEEGTSTEHVHYLGDVAIHIWKEESDQINEIYTRYLHHDHIGSIVAKSDENAENIEWMAYDAWGLRQDKTWKGSILDTSYTPTDSRRGYTGHEHMDGVGLIHMNGRVYDPNIGRFLSADLIVSDPENTQSFNRYAYVWNNPLSMTDPSGFDPCGGQQATNPLCTSFGAPADGGVTETLWIRKVGTEYEYENVDGGWTNIDQLGANGYRFEVSNVDGKEEWKVVQLPGQPAVRYSIDGTRIPGAYPAVDVQENAPDYDPDSWNDGGRRNDGTTIQGNSNCYAYSANVKGPFDGEFGMNPGDSSGESLRLDGVSVEEIRLRAISDGLSATPIKGGHQVYLIVAPGEDYHWYRKDSNGFWSHKPGATRVTNVDASGKLISDPSMANHNYSINYTKLGGSLWVPPNFNFK